MALLKKKYSKKNSEVSNVFVQNISTEDMDLRIDLETRGEFNRLVSHSKYVREKKYIISTLKSEISSLLSKNDIKEDYKKKNKLNNLQNKIIETEKQIEESISNLKTQLSKSLLSIGK